MRFHKHSPNLPHAYLSPSSPHWLNYNDDKFDRVISSMLAASRGTKLHALAQMMIQMGHRGADDGRTLNAYVNDCIGFRMETEQIVLYSENCYGTADALSFRQDVLRIFDLKTGMNQASFKQLEVYAALFCLEYDRSPFDIRIELRIYQNDEVKIYEAEAVDIVYIMDRIKVLDRRINELREEAGE